MMHGQQNIKFLNKQMTDTINLRARTASGYRQSVERPRNADTRKVQPYAEAAKTSLIDRPSLYTFPKLPRFPFQCISLYFPLAV